MSIKFVKKNGSAETANLVITIVIATIGYFTCNYFQLDASAYVVAGMLSMIIEVK